MQYFEGKYDHLLHKNFKYGEQDCYATLCAFYDFEYGIELDPSYSRFEGWEREGLNLFVENYEKEGFYLVDLDRQKNWFKELRTGDVLLVSMHSFSDRASKGVPNHCAIWLEPRMIMHHGFRRKSEIREFCFRNSTTHILRHKDVPLIEKEVESLPFSSILSPRKRELLENARKAKTD